jgi:hypothetical protein
MNLYTDGSLPASTATTIATETVLWNCGMYDSHVSVSKKELGWSVLWKETKLLCVYLLLMCVAVGFMEVFISWLWLIKKFY